MENYIDIAQYIKKQEESIKEALNFHVDYRLMKKECQAVIDGTVQYLWNNGFGEVEIDLLIKDMLLIANYETRTKGWNN